MIRVILADDHHLVRQGIRALLEKSGDIAVVGEAEDGQEAVKLVERLVPDVLITDIAMPRQNGIQVCEQIRSLRLATQVVILSMHFEEALVRQALKYGAKGYLLKSSLSEELLLAVRAANRGEVYLSPAITHIVLEDFTSIQAATRETNPLDRLTLRERQVLHLVAEGLTNQAIARELNISVKTVGNHRLSLIKKLKVSSVAELTQIAIKHGLIFLDD